MYVYQDFRHGGPRMVKCNVDEEVLQIQRNGMATRADKSNDEASVDFPELGLSGNEETSVNKFEAKLERTIERLHVRSKEILAEAAFTEFTKMQETASKDVRASKIETESDDAEQKLAEDFENYIMLYSEDETVLYSRQYALFLKRGRVCRQSEALKRRERVAKYKEKMQRGPRFTSFRLPEWQSEQNKTARRDLRMRFGIEDMYFAVTTAERALKRHSQSSFGLRPSQLRNCWTFVQNWEMGVNVDQDGEMGWNVVEGVKFISSLDLDIIEVYDMY